MTENEYTQAVEWLYAQAPRWESAGKGAYKPGLQNIARLCDFFGNPQKTLRCVHIAGTNGKGSVSSMTASVLQEAGYRAGLYTSPHILDFTERIKVNGQNASRDFVFSFIQRLKEIPQDIRPSFFEFTTVMAFEYFRQQQVDFAVIEVGLGGRLDATNIIHPVLTAITSVAVDHQDVLGDTVEEIAAEKAGIIKEGIPVVCGEENPTVQEIIRNIAAEKKAEFIDATKISTDLSTDLRGNYQKKNIRVAVAITEELRRQNVRIPGSALRTGLGNVQRNTGLLGRWYEFSRDPLTICDTGHNLAGLTEVFSQLNEMPQRKHIILGFVNDKKIDEVLQMLPENAEYYFAKPYVARGRSPQEYEHQLKKSGIPYKIFEKAQDAYLSAKETLTPGEMIFVGGSNFIVGEFLQNNLQV